VDEVKNIRDKAVAMKAYAEQAKDAELIGYATEIRLRAERRAGELLIEMAARKERHDGRGHTKSVGSRSVTPRSEPKLADLGVTKTQSSRWQKLAEMPASKFEAKVAKHVRLAVASVSDDKAVVREARAETQADKKERRAEREAVLAEKRPAAPPPAARRWPPHQRRHAGGRAAAARRWPPTSAASVSPAATRPPSLDGLPAPNGRCRGAYRQAGSTIWRSARTGRSPCERHDERSGQPQRHADRQGGGEFQRLWQESERITGFV
jgi:hypothetical protein